MFVGAATEVEVLKQALVEAEKRAATERTEREKYEAQVGDQAGGSVHKGH